MVKPPTNPGTASDSDALCQRILETARYYWQLADRLYPGVLHGQALPAIRFDLGGSSAGQVQFTRRPRRIRPLTIRFNLAIARHNADTYIHRTVAHEIAHAVAVLRHGRQGLGHSQAWQHIMADFGQPAERCHQYDLSAVAVRRQRRFSYRCDCDTEQQLTTVRHNRQQRGERQYYCRRCHAPLRYRGPANAASI